MADVELDVNFEGVENNLETEFGEVFLVDSGVAIKVIAQKYSNANTYAVGDYVIQESLLYRCITAIDEPEEFDSEKWLNIKLADDVKSVKSALDTLSGDVTSALANKLDKNNPTGGGALSLNRKANSTAGYCSTTLGINNIASSTASFAEGESNIASNNDAHAEGYSTTASGGCSHAEGRQTLATGSNAHAEGKGTIAKHESQHVFGEFNTPDESTASTIFRGNYVEIVGNGTSDNDRSNARKLDWQGNETLAGDLKINGNTSLAGEISRLDGRIDNLPNPMIFKGTLGENGTITSLPNASASNVGHTYKVITAGTYAGQEAKVGDTFTSAKPVGASGYSWILFSEGDTDTDTWRAVKVNGTEKLGSGISSGSVDFVGSENIDVEFDSDGNKIGIKTKNIYTETEVDSLVADAIYAVLPSEVASGSIANFETDLVLPLKSAKYDVNAVQESGTPTPATPLPISGWNEVIVGHCDSNVLDITPLIDDIYYSLNNDGSIKVLQTDNRGWNAVTVCGRLKKGTYTLVRSVASGYCDIRNSIDNYSTATVMGLTSLSKTFTLSDDAYIKVKFGYGLTSENYPFDCFYSINVGSSVMPFAPYNGSTTLINLGGTYYGGHLTQDKAGHRQFEVTCVKEHISLVGKTYTTASGYDRYSLPLANTTTSGSSSKNKKCSVLSSYGYNEDATEHYYMVNQTMVAKFVENTFRSGEFDVVYPLETSYVIDLPDGTPITTIAGVNNIFCNTGDTEVVFKESVNKALSSVSSATRGGAKSSGTGEEKEPEKDEPVIDDPKEEEPKNEEPQAEK